MGELECLRWGAVPSAVAFSVVYPAYIGEDICAHCLRQREAGIDA
jgi:hypothetical protein